MSIRFVFAKIQINHEYGKEIVLFNQFFGRPPILSPDVMPAGLKPPPTPLKPLRLLPSPSDFSQAPPTSPQAPSDFSQDVLF